MNDQDIVEPADRVSFRKRLIIAQGAALFVVFALLGVLGWLATYAWLHYNARTLMDHEAEEIRFHIAAGDTMDVYRYEWHEPHHIYRDRRVDPYFVQAFDADSVLVHASANVFAFPRDRYPSALFEAPPRHQGMLSPLRIVRIDGAILYFGVYPVSSLAGRTLGYLQVARYEPGISGTLQKTAIGLTAALGSLFIAMLLLTGWVAGRVVAPLQAITQATHEISPRHLHHRIPLPASADRETARLAETLNNLLNRIETSFQEMKRFTSNASHELQTPLTVLRGHIEVALRRPRDEAAYRETLAFLIQEVDGMSAMVHNLLVLARLDRDSYVAQHAPVDLRRLLADLLPAFRERAESNGLVWKEHLDGPAWVNGHQGLLQEAIENVLDNALKYTPSGRIDVILEFLPETSTHALRIIDTGIGMTPETAVQATDRFFRCESVQGMGISGSGLGLSIVAQIVSFHDGRLHVDATPENGAAITIELPSAPSFP